MLGGFGENFLPARSAFGGCGDQRFFRTGGGERSDFRDAEFGGLFEGPFETIEFDDGEQERGVEFGRVDGDGLEERELDGIAAGAFDAGEPDGLAVAELVELAGGGAEDAGGVMGGIADENGAATVETVDKEAAAHGQILEPKKSKFENRKSGDEATTRRLVCCGGSG